MSVIFKPLKLGLALGGGAARGVSHIGVMEVFDQAGIPIDIISGTSMGSIIGALYMLEGGSANLAHRLHEFVESKEFRAANFEVMREQRNDDSLNWFDSLAINIKRGVRYSHSLTRQSIIEREVYDGIINSLLPDINIEDLPKPFSAVSFDVVSGEDVIWSKGSLRQAVSASCAIPGIFPPLEINGMVLVDGGWTKDVPVQPARSLGADIVVGVDISRVVDDMVEYKRGVNIVLRAATVASRYFRQIELKKADFVIKPDVGEIHWADFRMVDHLIQRGRESALPIVESLRKNMKRKWVLRLLKRSAA